MTIEFERHIHAQELLNANAIIYPQYSLAPKTKTTFLEHLAIIIAHFWFTKALETFGKFVGPLLDLNLHDQQSKFLKLTMKIQAQATMVPPLDYNITTKLSKRFASSGVLSHQLSWFKLVKLLCMAMFLGRRMSEPFPTSPS
jgi:hypothetical protein